MARKTEKCRKFRYKKGRKDKKGSERNSLWYPSGTFAEKFRIDSETRKRGGGTWTEIRT